MAMGLHLDVPVLASVNLASLLLTLAAAIAIWPILLLSRWYGLKLALLAPFGICSLAPKLFAGALEALAARRVEWKGRVI